MNTYSNMTEVRAANRRAGFHFFDEDTLRFFRSRVGDTLYVGPAGDLFITSEQFVGSDGVADPRRYTVRRANPDGSIDTLGEFGEYASSAAARRGIMAAHRVEVVR